MRCVTKTLCSVLSTGHSLCLPQGTAPQKLQHLPNETVFSFPSVSGENALNLGHYRRELVTNCEEGRAYFDYGLQLMLSYQHEMASKCFLACLEASPHCALAHGLISLCHSPNYNFKGEPYYESACHFDDVYEHDMMCVFPSQQVADRHSKMAVEKIEELRRLYRASSKKKGKKGKRPNKAPKTEGDMPEMISEVETQLLSAIRILTCCPGVDPALSEETVGRPYADAMRKVYQRYPQDPEIVYCFAESLMVLNAWQLYEYPSGQPVSPDVEETRSVLERALAEHPSHAGLCHLYVHLSEMSAHPGQALRACETLRTMFPDAGHLLHMSTHIDVLVGNYESCVEFNARAIVADRHVMERSPATAGKESFYFGYIVHNYHMLVFGAILGGMEAKAMEAAEELNTMVNEDMFIEYENLAAYLESYSALDIHTMVRFGRWKELLEVELPKNKRLMIYRAASILFARGLALAATGDVKAAKKEADRFDTLRKDSEVEMRILHNNSVAALLAVDAVMLRGEIAYREGKYDSAFALLRRAVEMQDDLNYDEPWGKMQPIRHALGGLLLEQGHVEEAIGVFRKDLKFHPKNPFALVGLLSALKKELSGCCCKRSDDPALEIADLEQQLAECRERKWADFDVVVACECCQHPE